MRLSRSTVLFVGLTVLASAGTASADRREYILIVNRQPGDVPDERCQPRVWSGRGSNSIEWDDTGQVTVQNGRFTLPPGV
jgi:hypothetical protein